MSITTWIIASLVAGFLARQLVPGAPQEGLITTAAIGFSGILIGKAVAPMVGITGLEGFSLAAITTVVLSAALVLFLCRLFAD